MSSPAKRSLAAALIVLVAALAAASAIAVRAWKREAATTLRTRRRVSAEDAAAAMRDVPGLAPIALRTNDGLTLKGWFSPGTRRAAVILVHGGGDNRLGLFPEAKVLARHGYGILVYDARASGESEGALQSWGDREQRDVTAALDFLAARPDIDPDKVALLGFSIGGSTAAMAAARDPRVKALILYATWTSLEDEMTHSDARWGPLSALPKLAALRHAGVQVENVRPIDHLRELSPRPLLMVAGANDDDTPVPVMQRLFAAAAEPKELWVVPGAVHGTVFEAAPAEWEARVTAFLERALFPGAR